MGKLFQVHEADLAELERILPEWQSALIDVMAGPGGNRVRVQVRRVQEILQNVRWNYGPWSDITRIDANENQEPS